MEYNLAIKKEWSFYICCIDDPWKYYAKLKKPNTKDHILYDSGYMKSPE
jgi:hypothetical protein